MLATPDYVLFLFSLEITQLQESVAEGERTVAASEQKMEDLSKRINEGSLLLAVAKVCM